MGSGKSKIDEHAVQVIPQLIDVDIMTELLVYGYCRRAETLFPSSKTCYIIPPLIIRLCGLFYIILTDSNSNGRKTKIDAIVSMKHGAAMLKYDNRAFPHFHRFQISNDLTKLLWYHNKKKLKKTQISIKDIKFVLEGQQTQTFIEKCEQKSLEKASFSIVYGSELKSLDVVAMSAEDASLWIQGLKGLIKANNDGKLHKVKKIMIEVDLDIISKKKYRTCSDEQRRYYTWHYEREQELVEETWWRLKKLRHEFQCLIDKISSENNIINSEEYMDTLSLTYEIEERLDGIEYGLKYKTDDLGYLKREAWILDVEIRVLKDTVNVISKIKTVLPYRSMQFIHF